MRTLLLGDICAAARALMLVQDDRRATFLQTMIQQADAAHRFRKRLSKPHPQWGNGSLMARANTEPQVDEPLASDTEYLQALHMVIGNLVYRRGRVHAGLVGDARASTRSGDMVA